MLPSKVGEGDRITPDSCSKWEIPVLDLFLLPNFILVTVGLFIFCWGRTYEDGRKRFGETANDAFLLQRDKGRKQNIKREVSTFFAEEELFASSVQWGYFAILLPWQ